MKKGKITRFAGYPSAFMYDTKGGKKKVQHLLWGDWISITKDEGDWLYVHSRGNDGWIKAKDVQREQLLEVNFVDIGQGDGCFIVTPDNKFILIDAGQGDNMFRFLRWRFGLKSNPKRKIRFHTAIMSHPDSDHYAGFEPLFESGQLEFETLYHNGILEQNGTDVGSLGNLDKSGKYLLSVYPDLKKLEKHVNNDDLVGKGLLARVFRKALECTKDIRMITNEDEWVPGFNNSESVSLQVLAPIPEKVERKLAYRLFGTKGRQKGPTKNGHSVVLKLFYNEVSMLLGGDLNVPSESYLLSHYAGDKSDSNFLSNARKVFKSDIAKACHHGSADLSVEFIQAVDPIATIISSGDDESHSHPRPDALGVFGRHGRGDRPLIFSTELARSAPERIKNPNAIKDRVTELLHLLSQAKDEESWEKLAAKIESEVDLDRSVAVYGMINVRTDGKNVIIAQKLEKPRDITGEKWDIHRLESGPEGLSYVSKH
jgi:beta-lactamase superfamily II metal-dependent hydrolase